MALTLAMLLLVAAPACTGLEPALIGAVAHGARAGATAFKAGKLHAAEPASGEQVLNASLMAVEELAFNLDELENDDPDDNRWSLHLKDDRGWTHHVRIDQRTERLTKLQIDVGLLGSEAVAREIYDQIRANLDAQAELAQAQVHRGGENEAEVVEP